jgi:hypothetical protein
MARLYFHCSSERKSLVDRVGLDLGDPREAGRQAEWIVRSLVALPCLEDWRGWTMQVRDECGEPLLTVPFASALGKPN